MRGLTQFEEREAGLFEIDVNERALTHKIAEYLQPLFNDWNVDCEYNRLGAAKKVLPFPREVQTDDTDGQTIYPDIIVHRRGRPENLVVIEVKKTTNKRNGDRERLVELTRKGYGYRVGLHCMIDCKNGRIADIVAYTGGELDEALTAKLKGH